MALLIFSSLTSIATFVRRIRVSQRRVLQVLFCALPKNIFLSHLLLLDFIYFLSSDESDLLDDESDNDGSDSGSSGTCALPFHFYGSIGRVSCVGSVFFVPVGVESNCDVVTCHVCCVCTNWSQVQKWSTHRNVLALEFLIFPPNFKINFITIVLVIHCHTHSQR